MVNVWDITGPVLVLGSGVSVARLAAAAGVRMVDGEMGRVETGPGAASPRPSAGTTGPHLQGGQCALCMILIYNIPRPRKHFPNRQH